MLSVVPTLSLPERGNTMAKHTNRNTDRRNAEAGQERSSHERYNVDRHLHTALMSVGDEKIPVQVLVTEHFTGKGDERKLVNTSTRILPEDLQQGMKQYVASRNLSLDEVKKDAKLTRLRLQDKKDGHGEPVITTNREFATFDGGPKLYGDKDDGEGWRMIPFSDLDNSAFLESFAYFRVEAAMTHIYLQKEVTVASNDGPICKMRCRTIDAARRTFWKNFLDMYPGCDWTSKPSSELLKVLKAKFSK